MKRTLLRRMAAIAAVAFLATAVHPVHVAAGGTSGPIPGDVCKAKGGATIPGDAGTSAGKACASCCPCTGALAGGPFPPASQRNPVEPCHTGTTDGESPVFAGADARGPPRAA